MHQPGSTTVQFSVDEVKRIACQFLDVPQASVLTVTPTEGGLSGSTTCILTHCDTGRRHVLKQLPLHLSIDHIRWTQSLAAFTHGQGYTLLPVAINHCDASQGFVGAAPRSPFIQTGHCGSVLSTSMGIHVKLHTAARQSWPLEPWPIFTK